MIIMENSEQGGSSNVCLLELHETVRIESHHTGAYWVHLSPASTVQVLSCYTEMTLNYTYVPCLGGGQDYI